MDLARSSLLVLMLAGPLSAAQAQVQLASSASVTLVVTVPPRLSIRSLTPPRVEVRSRTEIEVISEIEVAGNTRYTVVVRPVRPMRGDAGTSLPAVQVSVRDGSGALRPLDPVNPLTIVSNGTRSGRHELRCVVKADDPALVQPNRCALVFEVTSVDGERLLRAAAVLDLEDALQITPRASVFGQEDRE